MEVLGNRSRFFPQLARATAGRGVRKFDFHFLGGSSILINELRPRGGPEPSGEEI